jgi:hypothetical protein
LQAIFNIKLKTVHVKVSSRRDYNRVFHCNVRKSTP